MKQNSGGLHPVGNAIFSLYTLERSSCSRLERKLKEVPGITKVSVNYAADIVQVKFDPTKVTSDDIRTIMKKIGNAVALRH
jgi:copper chaperone CopZ